VILSAYESNTLPNGNNSWKIKKIKKKITVREYITAKGIKILSRFPNGNFQANGQ
jgi:hypothetical protein